MLIVLTSNLEASRCMESRVTLLFIARDTRLGFGISTYASRLAVLKTTDGEISESCRARSREFLSLFHAASDTRSVHLKDRGTLIRSGKSSTSTNIGSKVRANGSPCSFISIGSTVNGCGNLSHKFGRGVDINRSKDDFY